MMKKWSFVFLFSNLCFRLFFPKNTVTRCEVQSEAEDEVEVYASGGDVT